MKVLLGAMAGACLALSAGQALAAKYVYSGSGSFNAVYTAGAHGSALQSALGNSSGSTFSFTITFDDAARESIWDGYYPSTAFSISLNGGTLLTQDNAGGGVFFLQSAPDTPEQLILALSQKVDLVPGASGLEDLEFVLSGVDVNLIDGPDGAVLPTTSSQFQGMGGQFLVEIRGFAQDGSAAGAYVPLKDIAFSIAPAAVQPPPPTGVVPEPATWAMMILGFGMAGGLIRRRQGQVFA